MLSDYEAAEIERRFREGEKGPVAITWVGKLLEDRRERLQHQAYLCRASIAAGARRRPCRGTNVSRSSWPLLVGLLQGSAAVRARRPSRADQGLAAWLDGQWK